MIFQLSSFFYHFNHVERITKKKKNEHLVVSKKEQKQGKRLREVLLSSLTLMWPIWIILAAQMKTTSGFLEAKKHEFPRVFNVHGWISFQQFELINRVVLINALSSETNDSASSSELESSGKQFFFWSVRKLWNKKKKN